MVIIVGHIVSILVFLAVIVSAIYMAVTLKSSTLPPCYLWVPRAVAVILFLQATIYLSMQADYLLGPHGFYTQGVMEDPISILYSLLNGITLVTVATGMNILFRWRRKALRCMSGCPMVKDRARIL